MVTYATQGRPTVTSKPGFNPGHDADELRTAMKGLGTNEKVIVDILSKRTFSERARIAESFLNSYGKHLDKELADEVSGDFQALALSSLQGSAVVKANAIWKAIKGVGTDDKVLIQILATASNDEIKDIRVAYENVLKRDLEKDVRGDTGGAFADLLTALMQGNRDERDRYDRQLVEQDTTALYEAGEKHFSVDEGIFVKLMTQRHFLHIRQIAKTYKERYNKTLIEMVKGIVSGTFADTVVAIIGFSEDKAAINAKWINDTMAGLGTQNHDLIRLVLTRCEIDMEDIKDAFQRLYNKLLTNVIQDKTSGSYKKMLVGLCGIN